MNVDSIMRRLINTSTITDLNAVFFTDSQNGFMVGGNPLTSLIIKTTDGGNSWITINSPATVVLQGIFFPSPLIGYIVGWNGQIFKSIDGGNNWISQSAVANYGNLDVFFTDNNTGYIVGGDDTFAGIQKTTDGGQNWYAQSALVNQGLIGVSFPTDSIGYAVGATGTILKTTNGGETGISLPDNSQVTILTYPNPANDKLYINGDFSFPAEVVLLEITGRKVMEHPLKSTAEIIDIKNLSPGVYLLRLNTGKGSWEIGRAHV